MEFEKRLEKAIQRGERVRDARGREEAEKALTEEDWKNRHSQYRLELSEHIEKCLRGVMDHFPGFQLQTIYGEEGWGAKIVRDDIVLNDRRQSENRYSRFEMVIRPFSEAHIIELAAKATIHNKEVFNRTHYQLLSEADLESFSEMIDLWALEYAEQYASRG